MAEVSFYENEALDTCLRGGLDQLDADIDLVEVIEAKLGVEVVSQLNVAIANVCEQGLSASEVEVIETAAGGGDKPLDWRIGNKRGSDGRPVRMRFIRVRDSGPKVVINIVGIAISAIMLSGAVVTNVMQLCHTIYESVVTLKSPADDDAMAAYEALCRRGLEAAAEGGGASAALRPSDLSTFGGPSGTAAGEALRRLEKVGIAKVDWGGRAEDYSNPNNQWTLKA